MIAEARPGEMIESARGTTALTRCDPLVVRVFQETVRLVRPGSAHVKAALAGEGLGAGIVRLAGVAPGRAGSGPDGVHGRAPAVLQRRLAGRVAVRCSVTSCWAWPTCRPRPARSVLPLLAHRRAIRTPELALEVLAWSADPKVAPALLNLVLERVPVLRRSQGRRCGSPAGAALGAARGALPRRCCGLCAAILRRRWSSSCCWRRATGIRIFA